MWLGKEQEWSGEEKEVTGGNCILCQKKVLVIEEDENNYLAGISGKDSSGNTFVYCDECCACSICGTKPKGPGLSWFCLPTPLCEVWLCGTHFKAFRSYGGKPLEELPNELLNGLLKRLIYVRSIWETRADEILKSGAKRSKWQAFGEFLEIFGPDMTGANYWQLQDLKKNATMKDMNQSYRDFIASLDAKITQVKEIVKDRGQVKVLQQLQQNSSERSSADAIAILKRRFA